MGRYAFEYWQHPPWQQQGSRKKWILLQIEKTAESNEGNLTWHVFSLEDA